MFLIPLPQDLPEDTAPINLAMALNDGEELDAAKRRIAELEALLEEERRKVSQLSKHPRPSFSLQLLSIIPS